MCPVCRNTLNKIGAKLKGEIMKFFKLKDYLNSWSVWVLTLLTVLPQINEQLQVVTDNTTATYTSVLALIGLIVRAIKQPM